MALQRRVFQLLRTCVVQNAFTTRQADVRGIKRWVAPTLREIQRRKDKLGEQPPSPRSSYLEWNYDAEIFAFGKRLGEEFDQNILKKALVHKSYINAQEIKLTKEGSTLPVNQEENTQLIKKGDEIISAYIKKSLEAKSYPDVIIKSIYNYLTSEEMLSKVASDIGLKDIILTSEFPVEKSTLANTFKAIVGALEESTNEERSQTFVQDILMCQLNGKEIFDIWEPSEPYEYLIGLLKNKQLEPRLCNQSASNTILANYQVGIYSDKKLLGIGWGESVDTAKNTAALNAIQKIYNIR